MKPSLRERTLTTLEDLNLSWDHQLEWCLFVMSFLVLAWLYVSIVAEMRLLPVRPF